MQQAQPDLQSLPVSAASNPMRRQMRNMDFMPAQQTLPTSQELPCALCKGISGRLRTQVSFPCNPDANLKQRERMRRTSFAY